jgi:hypothetical protein
MKWLVISSTTRVQLFAHSLLSTTFRLVLTPVPPYVQSVTEAFLWVKLVGVWGWLPSPSSVEEKNSRWFISIHGDACIHSLHTSISMYTYRDMLFISCLETRLSASNLPVLCKIMSAALGLAFDAFMRGYANGLLVSPCMSVCLSMCPHETTQSSFPV